MIARTILSNLGPGLPKRSSNSSTPSAIRTREPARYSTVKSSSSITARCVKMSGFQSGSPERYGPSKETGYEISSAVRAYSASQHSAPAKIPPSKSKKCVRAFGPRPTLSGKISSRPDGDISLSQIQIVLDKIQRTLFCFLKTLSDVNPDNSRYEYLEPADRKDRDDEACPTCNGRPPDGCARRDQPCEGHCKQRQT